ncbi:MAG: hypothetical protein K2Y37_11545 [Pirellulales bacterium]|nr:hypothetical protein [Pirellulales bacterium]
MRCARQNDKHGREAQTPLVPLPALDGFGLTAILAWAMACRPYYKDHFDVLREQAGILQEVHGDFDPEGDAEDLPFEITSLNPYTGFNPALRWPALALAAFLAWKCAWAVVERRCRRAMP